MKLWICDVLFIVFAPFPVSHSALRSPKDGQVEVWHSNVSSEEKQEVQRLYDLSIYDDNAYSIFSSGAKYLGWLEWEE